jgi:hypothetical protein
VAIDLNTDERIAGGGTIIDSTSVLTQVAGFGGAILPNLTSRYSYGTGANQANKWYLARRTLAATTFDNLNLTSGLSALAATQAFTALKRVLIAIVDPDGTKKLRIGPQAQANANQLWFQAVTANFWEETYTWIFKDRPITGWAVGAGATDILSIYNPGASSLDYAIWLLGTGA